MSTTTSGNSESELILDTVRGRQPWQALESLGIRVSIREVDDGPLEVSAQNPRSLCAQPTASDVAQGLLHYSADPSGLRTWAVILLAGISFIDLSEFEGHPLHDGLLDAIWDACGGSVAQESLRLATRVAGAGP